MAFANGLRSPQNESSFPSNYAPPIRPIGSQLSSTAATSSAERAQLHRRFTTNALPTLPTLSSFGPLSPIGQQRRQAAEPPSDLAAAVSAHPSLLAVECCTFVWSSHSSSATVLWAGRLRRRCCCASTLLVFPHVPLRTPPSPTPTITTTHFEHFLSFVHAQHVLGSLPTSQRPPLTVLFTRHCKRYNW